MSSHNVVRSAIAKTNDKYFIIEHDSKSGWFLFDIDVDATPVEIMWTKSEKSCWAFESVEVAQDYINEHIKNYRVKVCDG